MSQREIVRKDFDKKSQGYHKRYEGCTVAAHSFMIRRKRVCELLGSEGPGKVLDIGCGPGVMAEYLTKRGFDLFGLDISKRMIDECAAKFGHIKNAHFSVGNIERLEFPDSFFDTLICMGVVEYLDDDNLALKEMARVLKPGGVMVITLPNKRSPYRIWYKIVFNKGVRTFVNKTIKRGAQLQITHREYTEEAYGSLLKSYGFETEDIIYYNFNLCFFPLDIVLSRIAVFISKNLEHLCRSKIRRLGTGFIIKAKKIRLTDE